MASMLVAAALLALAPAVARAGTAKAVVSFSGSRDAIGTGQQPVLTPANSPGSVSATSAYLEPHLSCAPSRSSASIDFALPPVQALTPAGNDTAQRTPFGQTGHPGIDSFGDGRRCDESEHRVEAIDFTASHSRQLQRRWIVYQPHGERAAPAQRGPFEYRAGDITPPPPWMVSAPGTTGPNLTLGGGAAAGSPAPPAASTREPPGEEPCPDRRYDPVFVLRGSRGADRIRGDRHGELVLAGAGADRVFAGAGNDCVDGGPGRDRLSGGTGDDVLSGGTGADALSGGAGDDLLIAGGGRDRLDCGSGRRDVARVERGDRVRRCERVVRAR
jgi:hemolysin type calcium-binding protein